MPAIPYVGSLYDYAHGPGAGISQLMLEQGRARAANSERQGQIWGGTVANLGGLAGQEIERKQEFKRSQALSQAMEAYISDPNAKPEQAYLAVSKIMEPSKALTVANGMVAFKKAAAADTPPEIALAELPNIWDTYKILPEAMRPGTLAKIKQALGSKIDMSQVPDQLTPEAEKAIDTYIDKLRPKKDTKLIETSPGATLYNPETKEAEFTAPSVEKPEKPESLDQQYAKASEAGDTETMKRILADKRRLEEAGRAPQQPSATRYSSKEITVDGKDVLANYDSAKGKYYDINTGEELKNVGQPRTPEMRSKEAAQKQAGKSISAMKKLSESIIKRIGPAQRADAAKRGAEAVFGTDPEFRTYQDMRRSLAINIAVTKQGGRAVSDADVAAELLTIPDPYRDTSESTKLKWDMIGAGSEVPPPPPGFELMQ